MRGIWQQTKITWQKTKHFSILLVPKSSVNGKFIMVHPKPKVTYTKFIFKQTVLGIYKNGMLHRQYKMAQKVKRLVDCRIYDKELQHFKLWPFIRE